MKKAIALWVLLLSAFCANAAFAMTEQMEAAVGRGVDEKIKKKYGVFNDPGVKKYVGHVGLQMVNVSERPDIIYHFVILDTDEINAIASVGGYVYITKGLLGRLDSEAQLAAALGTEIVHVARRHLTGQIEKDAMQYANMVKTRKDSVLYSSKAAYDIIESGFNKKLQTDADIRATEYLVSAGYSAQGMIDYIDVIQVAERENFALVYDFVRTHHKTTKRVDAVRCMLDDLKRYDLSRFESTINNYYPDRYKESVLDAIK